MDDLTGSQGRLLRLSKRQREVLQLVCEGKTYAEISAALFITESAVLYHMGHVYAKLGLEGLARAARQRELGQFCVALRQLPSGQAQPQPEPPAEPEIPPQRALQAVMEDAHLTERRGGGIQAWGSVPIPPGDDRVQRWRLLRGVALVGLVALLAGLTGGGIAALILGGRPAGPVVVSGGTPGPPSPAPTATLAPPVIVATVAPSPTSTVAASPTPITTPTPQPTSTAAPSPTPTTAPARTPPAPGTLLYEADWSAGLGGWPGTFGWKPLNGMLLSDGSNREADNSIAAPYQPGSEGVADYAVEAEMQMVRDDSCSSFGIIVRDAYTVGTQRPICNYEYLAIGVVGDRYRRIAERRFETGKEWHLYRVETRKNVIRVSVDGALLLEAIDNRYLSGGKVGLWSAYTQVNVRSFRVIAL